MKLVVEHVGEIEGIWIRKWANIVIFFILYTYESLKNKEKYSQEKSKKNVVTHVFTLKTLERRPAGLSRFHTSQDRVLTN